jgi:hypothetical protein
MRWTILAAGCGVALMLGGCNLITSPTPMFSSADVRGQAQTRPGVWTEDQKDCAFDERQPMDTWPHCASGWVVQPGGVLAAPPGDPPPPLHLYPTLLVAGDPPILQVRADDKPGAPPTYVYLGVKVLKTDAEGRITAYKGWPALCGPPPPKNTDGSPTNNGRTLQIIEGLKPDPDGANCIASTPAPIRLSAARSEAWRDNADHDHAHWVRDGEK